MNDDKVDASRRKFLLTATSVVGGAGVAMAAVPFLASWAPSARAKAAGAPVTVDVGKMEDGQQLTVAWRGKPVWIIKRSDDVLQRLDTDEHKARLRDPDSQVDTQQPEYAVNADRSVNPNYLVLVGICTHLGCVPLYKPTVGELGPDWEGGFFCPCHGSRFDLAGRVYKDVPAPINLEVPPYYFTDDTDILIGEDAPADGGDNNTTKEA